MQLTNELRSEKFLLLFLSRIKRIKKEFVDKTSSAIFITIP